MQTVTIETSVMERKAVCLERVRLHWRHVHDDSSVMSRRIHVQLLEHQLHVLQVLTVLIECSVTVLKYVFLEHAQHELRHAQSTSSVVSRHRPVQYDDEHVYLAVNVTMVTSVMVQRSVQVDSAKRVLLLVVHYNVMKEMIVVVATDDQQHERFLPSLWRSM